MKLKYVGKLKTVVPGVGIVVQGQTVPVPAQMVRNLLRSEHWEEAGNEKEKKKEKKKKGNKTTALIKRQEVENG